MARVLRNILSVCYKTAWKASVLILTLILIYTDGGSVMVEVGKLMSCYQQLCFAHGLQLAVVDILYKKNIEREEEHQEITSDESDTDDEDTNDTHEEQGVTVTKTTDPRHLHLSRAEVIPRYNDFLQKVRKVVKLFKRSPTKYDMYLQKYVKEDTGKELSLILDCRTRWNSLLAVIERFHKLKVCIDKALIDIESDTTFSDLEWSKIKDLIESLQPFKLAVEALCRRDSTLLTAETTLKFILEKLNIQDTMLSAELSEALRVRIEERRTVVIGWAEKHFFRNRYSNSAERVFSGFNKQGVKYFFDWIISSVPASHLDFGNLGKNWQFLLGVGNIFIFQYCYSNSAVEMPTGFNKKGVKEFFDRIITSVPASQLKFFIF
ncbi:hypothetical protein AVEN_134664-1 [Araneus ventricosus]|uniref:Uncharacterized protein n=1 Tax=Araneus ventricosus TaxID=182803 RepID=A0A4Y2F2U7_ARAVE|nr:hypothetical protein AVEN_134664-1 [Araneus ventricosus]